jgi:hypothetical protein
VKIKTLLSLLFLLTSCSVNDCKNSQNIPLKNISVNNLVDEISLIETLDDFNNFLIANKNVLFPFYEMEDSLLISKKTNNAFSLINNIYFDSLSLDVVEEFDNLQETFFQFDKAIEILNNESNKVFLPKITVLTSGFFNDVVVNKENVVIGLDYFLPQSNKYKPRDLPAYILDRYTPEHLSVTSLSTYLSQFNLINEQDLTMINEMISFGKLYYVVSKLLPCIDERIVLGYSAEEYNLLDQNEAFIYSYFLQNELLFDKSNVIKQKYLSERPSTFEISQSVPGRVGRWLGWKIVSSFMMSSTYTLEELLREDDYKNIFYNSNYNPI